MSQYSLVIKTKRCKFESLDIQHIYNCNLLMTRIIIDYPINTLQNNTNTKYNTNTYNIKYKLHIKIKH